VENNEQPAAPEIEAARVANIDDLITGLLSPVIHDRGRFPFRLYYVDDTDSRVELSLTMVSDRLLAVIEREISLRLQGAIVTGLGNAMRSTDLLTTISKYIMMDVAPSRSEELGYEGVCIYHTVLQKSPSYPSATMWVAADSAGRILGNNVARYALVQDMKDAGIKIINDDNYPGFPVDDSALAENKDDISY